MVNPGHKMEIESHPVIIPDSFLPHSVASFRIPSFYKEDIESVLIPEGLIRDRIKGLAYEIFTTYAKTGENVEPLVLVCVLKSAFKFFCALQQELEILNTNGNELGVVRSLLQNGNGTGTGIGNGNSDSSVGVKNGISQLDNSPVLPLLCEFIRVKSYVDLTSDVNNQVQIQGLYNPGEIFFQKNVLIVEDIIDSGRTMQALLHNLQQYNMKSVRVASMLWKRVVQGHATVPFQPHFYGFQIPDRFVIGYGLDYNERYRDLNHLCIINGTGIMKYAVQPLQKT